MKDHTVVCGLGEVGFRVLENLSSAGEELVVVEVDEESLFLPEAEARKVPVLVGDMRQRAVLERAGIEHAGALIACSNRDLVNLEAALHARELNPDIRVVLRIFDPALARRVEVGFGFETASSSSALAAPSFARAALDRGATGSLWIDGELMLELEIDVGRGSRLDGMGSERLRRELGLSILAHRPADGEQRRPPEKAFTIGAGDHLVVVAPADARDPLSVWAQP